MTKSRKTSPITIRSSVVEHLTFTATTGEGGAKVIYVVSELEEDSVTKDFRITANDVKHKEAA